LFAREQGFISELCSSLIKIHVKNAANLIPDEFYAILNFTHPELTERLAALEDSSQIGLDKQNKIDEV